MVNNSGSILVIGFVWPEPKTTAAGNRMLQLLHFFLAHDYQLTFATTAAQTEFSLDLGAMGIGCQQIELNSSSFNDFLVRLAPNLVVFDRFLTEEQFGWRVAEAAPDALRVLDTEDLHSLRSVREHCFRARKDFSIDQWLRSDIAKREIASIYRSDLSLIISSFEIQLLKGTAKIDGELLMLLPFQIDEIGESQRKQWLSFEERTDFICIGNGKHAPNIDAVYWLKTEIWPLIRKALPKVALHIYGAYLPQHIEQMHNTKEGFYVHGWVDDISGVLGKSRVNLAPLRFGAGIKGKLIDAMCNGTPNITTRIGAEGMHADLAWNGILADSANTLAQEAVALYSNKAQWQKYQDNGTTIVNDLYSKMQHDLRLQQRLDVIKSNLNKHRAHNFIGSMLMHQTMASTKYMSKWIEAKNKF